MHWIQPFVGLSARVDHAAFRSPEPYVAVSRPRFVPAPAWLPLAVLLAVAIAARLYGQPGIPLYPDSYEFLLAAKRLNPLVGGAATMGSDGDVWSIPFHRVGFSLIAAPFSTFPNALSALAIVAGVCQGPTLYLLLARISRSRWAAFSVAVLAVTSFSAVAWSYLPMSDSTALLLALVSTLLLLRAIDRGGLASAATVASLALLLTVRAELVLLFPGLIALPWSVGKPSSLPRVARLLLGSVLLWLAAVALMAVVLGANLRGLDGGVWAILEANLLAPDLTGPRLGGGLATFVSYEAPLLAVAALGAAVSIGSSDRRGVVAALLIAFPLALYATRDDFRYYLYLLPGLCLLAVIGVEMLISAVWRRGRDLTLVGTVILPALAAAALVAAAVLQVQRLGERWHPETAYEQEVARSVSRVLGRLAVPDETLICVSRPEPYFLDAGHPARALVRDRPAGCFEGLDPGQGVVIVEDADVQYAWRDALPAEIAVRHPRLLATIPSPSLFIAGEEHYLAVTPIRVLLLAGR